MNIVYDYADVPTIRDFAKNDKFIRGLMGPFGSGKSTGCLMEIIRRAHEQVPSKDGVRRTRWAVVRNTYPQLRDTTIKTVHDWFPPNRFGQWKQQDHDYLITGFKGCHIELMFRALDRPDQVSNLLSLELTGAWMNEAREIPKPIFNAIQGRVGRFPAVKDGGCTWDGIIMDTNPPDLDSWWYHLFEENLPENAAIFKQPSGLSPDAENRTHLKKNYYENLSVGKDPEWVKVYVKGEYGFVIDGKPIYPEYSDSVHCQTVTAVKGITIYRGWDFGLTPACVFTQLLPSGQWIVFDELVAEDMGIDRFSDRVIQYCNQNYNGFAFEDIGDPAGMKRSETDEKSCFQIMWAKNIQISGGEQDPTMRIESVKKPLNTLVSGKPGLVLSPQCKTLRKGFQGGYQYRRLQTSGDRFTEKPDKNQYSHPHDALQYIATRLFSQALRTPKTNDSHDRYSKKRSWLSWKTA